MSRTALTSRKSDPLNKKIPENPKYKHVKSAIDTGASLSKYLEHLDEIRKNYRYRKDEIFKRLKATTFAQLVLQIAGSEDANSIVEIDSGFDDSISPISSPTHGSTDHESPPDTARSTLSSIVTGVGELDVGKPGATSPPPPPIPLCPYLLLDVRDKEDYDRCHIISAKNYPATMLSRSCNYFTRDILEYKNKPGRIIILYDEDERVAPQAATTFVQREVDNVFLLSGGLKVIHKAFPEGMISGPVPLSYTQSPPGSARKKTSSSHLPPGQRVGISAAWTAGRNKFSNGDLQVLQNNLDDALSSTSKFYARQRCQHIIADTDVSCSDIFYYMYMYLDMQDVIVKGSRTSSRATTSTSDRIPTSASSRASSRTDSRAVSTRPWK